MIVDFHAHLLPGVDDGAQDREQAARALARVQAAGIATQVTTPHLDASLMERPEAWAQRLDAFDRAWRVLTELAEADTPELTLRRGSELKLDTPTPNADDERVRLAGTSFVLVEFPFMTVPPFSTQPLRHLRAAGWTPIIAHPERYHGLGADLDICREWRHAGAYLQVNGASLLGKYGDEARRRALALLEHGWVDYLGSDYHARGQPQVEAYRALLEEQGAGETMVMLTETNPARMLRDEAPLPAPRLVQRRGWMTRLAGALKR